jgi:hypothetical protein
MTTRLRLPVLIVSLCLAACGGDDPVVPGGSDLPDGPDVSGVWTATLDGTVINNEDGTGQTTTMTITLAQSGTEVTGTGSFTDTLARSGSETLSGTLVGGTFSYSQADWDAQCAGRTLTSTATVASTTPGSTMSISFSAPSGGSCPSLSGSLIYTKQ